MNKDNSKFFAHCPFCKKKFGIPAEYVFKYVDRIFRELYDDQKGQKQKRSYSKPKGS